MRVVITGGAGFIGSHLVEELTKNEGVTKIKIIDNLSSGKKENIAPFLCKKVEFIKGDVRDIRLLEDEFRGYNIIFHEAALIEVAKSINNPLETHEVNVNGTLNVLLAARDVGIRKVIFASSCGVYGDKTNVKEDSFLEPKSPYAISKVIGEEYCRLFNNLYGLETVILRYFNVYGKRQPSNTDYGAVVPNFIAALKKGEKPIIFGDGQQTRDFVYIKDIVAANLLALKKNIAGGTFNVAYGYNTSIINLLEIISLVLGKRVEPEFYDKRGGDIKHISANMERSINILRYKPKYSIERGLRDMLK